MKYIDLVKREIQKQHTIYNDVKNGNITQVCYQKAQSEEWGIHDDNYTNRLRLSYYLLYEQIDDEKIIEQLFLEELQDRKTNSFQGIGDSIKILTFLLQKHNQNGKYNTMFQR